MWWCQGQHTLWEKICSFRPRRKKAQCLCIRGTGQWKALPFLLIHMKASHCPVLGCHDSVMEESAYTKLHHCEAYKFHISLGTNILTPHPLTLRTDVGVKAHLLTPERSLAKGSFLQFCSACSLCLWWCCKSNLFMSCVSSHNITVFRKDIFSSCGRNQVEITVVWCW